MAQKKKKIKGFTLVETIVVIFIIVLLLGVALANYRAGERQYSLLRSAHKLAQDLREAEKMAMAAEISLVSQCQPTSPNYGYGLRFKKNTDSYFFFVDCDGDKTYTEGKDQKVLSISLEPKILISALSPGGDQVDVIFSPPDPTVTINPSAEQAEVTLQNIIDNQTKKVIIYSSGAIEIE
jgi:prepilin-type N-terminal cleavage/methylation domain-containing protein